MGVDQGSSKNTQKVGTSIYGHSSLLDMAKGETHAQQCAFPVKPRYLSYL